MFSKVLKYKSATQQELNSNPAAKFNIKKILLHKFNCIDVLSKRRATGAKIDLHAAI